MHHHFGEAAGRAECCGLAADSDWRRRLNPSLRLGPGIVFSPTWRLAESRGWSRGCAGREGTAHINTIRVFVTRVLRIGGRLGLEAAIERLLGTRARRRYSPTWQFARSRGWSRGRAGREGTARNKTNVATTGPGIL